MEKLISYGFTKEYLSDWGINEALREIYQNFMDYGEYTEDTITTDDAKIINVTLSNSYNPNSFEYLGLGKSVKQGNNNIGKHGEGLKVAIFVLTRANNNVFIKHRNVKLIGEFDEITGVGDVFGINMEVIDELCDFTVSFTIPKIDFNKFKDNIITKDDIIYKERGHGNIVKKPAGNIYSGGLFVAKVKKFQYAYDILPSNLSLDRDRRIPGAFDVTYQSSKIKQGYVKFINKMEGLDTEYSDSEYINDVPKSFIKAIKPKMVDEEPVFVHTDTIGVKTIIKNTQIIDAIKRDSIISRWLRWIKHLAIRKLGLYEMLVKFGNKHIHTEDARQEFDIILNKVKNG